MVFTAPIFTKFALAQIVANIPVPISFKIGRKKHKIRAKLCFLAEVSYGFILHRFSRNRQPQNGTTERLFIIEFHPNRSKNMENAGENSRTALRGACFIEPML